MKVSGTVCDRRDPPAILPGGHSDVGVNVTVTGETVTGSAQNCLLVTDGHGQVHITVKVAGETVTQARLRKQTQAVCDSQVA